MKWNSFHFLDGKLGSKCPHCSAELQMVLLHPSQKRPILFLTAPLQMFHSLRSFLATMYVVVYMVNDQWSSTARKTLDLLATSFTTSAAKYSSQTQPAPSTLNHWGIFQSLELVSMCAWQIFIKKGHLDKMHVIR